MGGGAFNLLKAGRFGAESAKQAEIGLAILPKILRIAAYPEARKAEGNFVRLCGNFRSI